MVLVWGKWGEIVNGLDKIGAIDIGAIDAMLVAAYLVQLCIYYNGQHRLYRDLECLLIAFVLPIIC